MKRLALWVVLASSLAFAEPGRALIWGGGATAGDADAAMKALDASSVRALLEFSPGFPKVVQSKDLKGLKAGFHIVLLGLCGAKDDALLALAAAKSEEEKVYARGVELEQPVSCPTLKAPWKKESSTTSGGLVVTALSNGHTLRMLALLLDEKLEPLDFATDDEECTTECTDLTTRAGDVGGAVRYTDVAPGCSTPNETDFVWQVVKKKKRLSAELVKVAFRKGQCD